MFRGLCRYRRRDYFFFLLLFLAIGYIFFSYPFFKIPYDMWDHLCQIGNIFREGRMYNFCPFFRVSGRGYVWYKLWAIVFKCFSVSSPWSWLRIIHIVQFFLVFSGCYFYFHTLFSFISLPVELKKYASFFSTIFWFIGVGFPSVAYHNTWIAWYSLNYQCMSMAFFWCACALALRFIFYKKKYDTKKWFLFVFYFLLLFLIIIIHPLEAAYLLIHTAFIILVFLFSVLLNFNSKRNWFFLFKIAAIGFIVFAFIVLFSLFIFYSGGDLHVIKVRYFPHAIRNFSQLYKYVISNGKYAVQHNKSPEIYNVLWGTSFCGLFFIILLSFANWKKNYTSWAGKEFAIILYTLLVSIFLLCITNIPFLAGFVALLVPRDQIYRFIFTVPCFYVIPLSVFSGIYQYCKRNKYCLIYSRYIGSLIICILIFILYFLSLQIPIFHHSFALNLDSMVLLTRFPETLSYSPETVKRLKSIVDKATPVGIKRPVYYIRGDMAMMLHFFYGCYVFSRGKFGLPSKRLFYIWNKHYDYFLKRHKRPDLPDWLRIPEYKESLPYTLIDIKLPDNFPFNKKIFKYFDLRKPISHPIFSILGPTGIIGELTGKLHVLQCIHSIPSISKIELLMANYSNRNNNKDIFLRLLDSQRKKIAEIKCNASEIKDNAWHTFKFKKRVFLDPYALYYIEIISPESVHGNAVTIYRRKRGRGGNLAINKKGNNGNLCMKIWE